MAGPPLCAIAAHTQPKMRGLTKHNKRSAAVGHPLTAALPTSRAHSGTTTELSPQTGRHRPLAEYKGAPLRSASGTISEVVLHLYSGPTRQLFRPLARRANPCRDRVLFYLVGSCVCVSVCWFSEIAWQLSTVAGSLWNVSLNIWCVIGRVACRPELAFYFPAHASRPDRFTSPRPLLSFV